MTRTPNQLHLYHGYFRQLYNHGVVKIQLDTKEWVGDLKQYVHNNYDIFAKEKDFKDTARYLLKIMDLELPTTNPITGTNRNKNHFEDAEKVDLTHHISWIKQILLDNKIIPFDEVRHYER